MPDIPIDRRRFLGKLGLGSLGATMAGNFATHTLAAGRPKNQHRWKPVSDRKIRFGIVGYGVCRFGAAFGFQDHPNVQIVAVSDLLPERRNGLMKACRCEKSYESLEVQVEAVKGKMRRVSVSKEKDGIEVYFEKPYKNADSVAVTINGLDPGRYLIDDDEIELENGGSIKHDVEYKGRDSLTLSIRRKTE